jgi:hypothetical protein
MAAWASPCPEGAIEGDGIGETADKAIEDANLRIARDIYSKAHSISIDSLIKKETDSSFDEESTRRRVATVETYMPNAYAIKNKDGKPPAKEGGNFAVKRYICRSDAARPYLSNLEHSKDSLKIFAQKINCETCRSTMEVYKQIRSWEDIVKNLGQTNESLRKEYNNFYDKIQEECGKIGKGIYIKSNDDSFGDKIGAVFAQNEYEIANVAKSASLHITLNVEKCNVRPDNMVEKMVFCNACVKIDLLNNKTGKSIYKDNFTGPKVGWIDESIACRKAYEKAVPALWEKIKGKFQKEDCEI